MKQTANNIQIGGDHYRHSSYQHWDWAWFAQLDSFQYPITKYVARWKRKNGFEDLDKAEHYLTKYIEVLGQNTSNRANISWVECRRWADAEKLDVYQHDICSAVANWGTTAQLREALELLREYTQSQRGGEPGTGYVDQDRQDCVVQVKGVGTEADGGL